MSKTSLLARIAGGDRDAVSECVTRYIDLIWWLARRYLRNRADAEDCVQEIFIDLWRFASRFDERSTSELAFVGMVSRRRLIDVRRKQTRKLVTISIPQDLDCTMSEGCNSLIFQEEVKRAQFQLSRLPLTERRVIALAIDDGLSHSQIAEALAIPIGTVKTSARRGLLRLRKLFHQDPVPRDLLPN